MAFTHARILTLLAVAGLMATGCGRQMPQLARPAMEQARQPVQARSVTPDQEFAKDLKRALYWDRAAVLVMSVHTTALNTRAISASANVFYSPERAYAGKTSVFVARHYGISAAAQYTEMPDFEGLASSLQPIGAYKIKAEEAWAMAKNWRRAPAPQPSSLPAGAQVKEQIMLSSRAFLIQEKGQSPTWNFYANSHKFTIDANSGQMPEPTIQDNPNDYMNKAREVQLQRAASTWLPTSLGQTNNGR